MKPSSDVPVLWQVATSIFCEKARWALDYKGIQHRRKNLMPGLHGLLLAPRGRGRTVPVLDLGGESIRDSTDIIAALEAARPTPPLYPARGRDRDRALELEDFFDEQCGHEVRRVGLDPILRDRKTAVATFFGGGPRLMRSAATVGFPLVRLYVRTLYGVDAKAVENAYEKIQEALDRIENTLTPSGYLVGGHFSVADLTGATLLAPLVRPREYPNPMKALPLPTELAAYLDSLSSRPAFDWVREMYHLHRGKSTAVA